jgi:hypothetical protein
MCSSILLIALVLGANAYALAITPRQQNSCFDMSKGACVGRQADANNAAIAITNACNKVTSRTPGETGHGRSRVTGEYITYTPAFRKDTRGEYRTIEWLLMEGNLGIVKGFPYTATLYVGDQCGGVGNWSTQGCVRLFSEFVDVRCENKWPPGDGLFQCKLMFPYGNFEKCTDR